MTNDDIIRMAREAGIGSALSHNGGELRIFIEGADWHDELMRFSALVAAAEREACAALAEPNTSNESAYQRGYLDGMAKQSNSEGLAEAQVVYQISLKNGAASSAWVDVDEAAYNSAKLYGEFDCRCLYTLPPKGEQTVPSDCPHSHQPKPLTDEQIDALELPLSGTATVRDLVRVIERAHGIGGGNG